LIKSKIKITIFDQNFPEEAFDVIVCPAADNGHDLPAEQIVDDRNGLKKA
jgi:hypothetical protein